MSMDKIVYDSDWVADSFRLSPRWYIIVSRCEYDPLKLAWKDTEYEARLLEFDTMVTTSNPSGDIDEIVNRIATEQQMALDDEIMLYNFLDRFDYTRWMMFDSHGWTPSVGRLYERYREFFDKYHVIVEWTK